MKKDKTLQVIGFDGNGKVRYYGDDVLEAARRPGVERIVTWRYDNGFERIELYVHSVSTKRSSDVT